MMKIIMKIMKMMKMMNYELGIMDKIFKTILISLVVIFGGLFLIVDLVQAENSPLEVEFEKTPLFKEANFLPGDSVTRWVRVTNNTGQPQRIATEAINWPGFPDPDDVPEKDLSRALEIIIREKGGSDLYGGSLGKKTLFDFYKDGEIYLSDVSSNGTKEYEFEITFPSDKRNEWQGATTTFDILIGFQGVEGKVPPGTPPGGGGGGGYIPGLTIKNEGAFYISTSTATITWQTSYFSTSKVIYDTQPGKFDLSAGEPSYGYTFYKEGDDSGNPKVTFHSVTLTGLTPSTTYYYRCVSHASPPTISREYSFTTLPSPEGEKLVKKEFQRTKQLETEKRELKEKEEEISFEIAQKINQKRNLTFQETNKQEDKKVFKYSRSNELTSYQKKRKRNFPFLIATISKFFIQRKLYLFFGAILGLVIVSFLIWNRVKKRKKN